MPKKNQHLSLNFPFDPLTLDSRKGADGTTSTLHFMLYEGLTRMNEKSTREPGIAYHIDISDDLCTYTFHLRESLWSNGDPVTAHDFEYTWKSMLKPSFPCPNAHLLYPIQNAEKVKKGVLGEDSLGICATFKSLT